MTESMQIGAAGSAQGPRYNPTNGALYVAETGTDGGLTDTQLRAAAVPVSGPLTDTQLRATSVPTTDAGPAWTSVHTRVNSADASGGVYVSPAPAAGYKLVVTDIIISVGSTINVTLREETTNTALMGPLYLLANTTIQLSTRGKGIKTETAGKMIKAVASGAGNITVETWTYQEV